MKRRLAILLALVMMISAFTVVSADTIDYGQKLKELGVIKGDQKGNLNADKNLTREEAIVTLTRMMGLADQAKKDGDEAPFTDVPTDNWARPYLGFAKKKGWTNGIGDGKFGLGDNVTTQEYVTFMLRALGYTGTDVYANAIEMGNEMHLLKNVQANMAADIIKRADVFTVMYNTLYTSPKGASQPLVYQLGLLTSVVDNQPNTAIEFKDSLGRDFKFDAPLTKVISLNRQTSEAIKILGAEDAVIATGDRTIKFNPYLGFNNLPDMGKTKELNIEAIISMEPQAVLTHTNRAMELEEKLEPAGIKVIRLDNYQPHKYDQEMRILAKIFGKEKRAEEFLAYRHEMDKMVAERVAKIAEKDKPRVMALSIGFMNSKGGYRIFPAMNTLDQPGVGEGYSTILAGGIDATPTIKYDTTKGSTTILVEDEFALEANPDVITLHGTWLGGYEMKDDTKYREVLDKIYKTTSITQTEAGKNKRTYVFHTDFLGASKRHLGLIQLGKYLHPELFDDLDTDAYAKEYFEKWLNVPFEGIWYYAPQK